MWNKLKKWWSRNTTAKVYLKSGAVLTIKCSDIKIKKQNGNDLIGYEFVNAKGGDAFYIRIDDISAITY